mmetsp:Transcript_8923/g.12104  ORF Transcript_8923/g.12104 Transcript_8923/m.12104 type:complete len:112 (+) Transcript_8923:193-528(+)|eukprot:CAMPEP_0196598076 /NCGR_PEP_ID=MMETSP1081-20130531/94109_1 /TAXON_ID=36882 /ORGANISM="Pyramimonas amylifera, Strain CCMP720" /LENGTH=111 /DNA_ID=CAMNT_0041923711 /DNA_START=192 /DNA_END=527 /DNA_ORIENTATION=+
MASNNSEWPIGQAFADEASSAKDAALVAKEVLLGDQVETHSRTGVGADVWKENKKPLYEPATPSKPDKFGIDLEGTVGGIKAAIKDATSKVMGGNERGCGGAAAYHPDTKK